MQDFRQLKVWEVGHRLTLEVYRTTRRYPVDEIYGIVGQMRRASSSIPANIAEGCGKSSDADFARYLQTAMGSACELEYFLLLSRDLEYIDGGLHDRLAQATTELKRMLTALMQKLRASR